jgi:hypothetical protein
MSDDYSNSWDEAVRRDLTHMAAVIIALPDLIEYGPGQDHTDRELNRQRLAWDERYEGVRQQFQAELIAAVEEAITEIPTEYLSDRLEARPYHVGPAAQGWPLYLVQFISDVRPILEDTVLVWTLGEIVKTLIKTAQGWKDSYQMSGRGSVLIFTEPLLSALVYNHVRETYRPEGEIVVSSTFRTEFPGYGEPEHPGGSERYLIQAKCGDVSYVYQVNSHAFVSEHFRVEGGEIAPLPLPNWHAEDFFPLQQPQPVRTVAIP